MSGGGGGGLGGYLYAEVQVELNKFELIWAGRGNMYGRMIRPCMGNLSPVNTQTDRRN